MDQYLWINIHGLIRKMSHINIMMSDSETKSFSCLHEKISELCF